MSTAQLTPLLLATPEFESSYQDFANYPCNLVVKSYFSSSLHDHKQRLELNASSMLTEQSHDDDGSHVFVIFREWNKHTAGFEKRNFRSDNQLKNWLETGNSVTAAPSSPGLVSSNYRKDPKCRFIYIQSGHSRARLQVTRQMLTRIFSFHQIMPAYLDFTSVFGLRVDTSNQRFSGRALRFTGFQHANASCLKLPSLATHGRSGRQYELCYNLKRVVEILDNPCPPGVPAEKSWSIQQAAFLHQFDIETGSAFWLTTIGDYEDVKKRIADLTGPLGGLENRSYGTMLECFRSNLAVHLTYGHWSTGGWRWYIEYLEDQIEKISQDAVVQPLHFANGRRYGAMDLQDIQHATDKTNEAIMVMKGNSDIMTRLEEFYSNLLLNKAFVEQVCGPPSTSSHLTTREALVEHINTFTMQLHSLIGELHMHVARAKLLVEISGDRNRMILQHLQGQATEKMQLMTSVSIKEAIVMRVITVVTLIFLPATFVSTFFSTDIVKYQGTNEHGAFSGLAMKRWLQVTLSLTFLTLGIGYVVYRRSKHEKMQQILPSYELASRSKG